MKKIIFIALIALALCFQGCSATDNNDIKTNAETFLQSMKDADFEKVKTVSYMGKIEPYQNEKGETVEIPEDGDLPVQEEEIKFHEKFFEKLSWELGEVKVDGENATIKAKITNKNIPQVFQMAALNVYMKAQEENKELTSEESTKLLTEEISKNLEQSEDVKSDVDIKLAKKDGVWKVERDEGVMLAIYGNKPMPPTTDGTAPTEEQPAGDDNGETPTSGATPEGETEEPAPENKGE